MADGFESGALLGHVYTLEDGTCVRLRLARTSDVQAIADLLARHGHGAPELEAGRLVHFDPRRRYVVCATGLVDGSETLLGVGAISLDPPATAPDLLTVDSGQARDVTVLLAQSLTRTGQSIGRYRAA